MKYDTITYVIQAAMRDWPPVFALSEIDQLSGGALRRRTLHNLRSAGKIPTACFLLHGKRKVLVVRDPFLAWWKTQLSITR